MPNGGLTPDCVHCKHYRGKPFNDEEPFCEYHKMGLASPIRVFCSGYIDPEPVGSDWLDQVLVREQLRQDIMYVWLGGYDVKFFYIPLAPIVDYRIWSHDKFFDELDKLMDKYFPNRD